MDKGFIKDIAILFAIVCITLLGWVAIIKGLDGTVVMFDITAIAGLAGYQTQRAKEQKSPSG